VYRPFSYSIHLHPFVHSQLRFARKVMHMLNEATHNGSHSRGSLRSHGFDYMLSEVRVELGRLPIGFHVAVLHVIGAVICCDAQGWSREAPFMAIDSSLQIGAVGPGLGAWLYLSIADHLLLQLWPTMQ
jgi:hypothetical protein